MELNLSGARVIVTAGANGIGRAIVDGFLSEGARVATCDIDETALASLPGEVMARRVDVADADALRAFVAAAIDALGGLDCLVNNAGVAGPTAPVEDVGLDQWNATLAICLTSQFVTASAAVAALRRSENPSVVNLSSVAGRVRLPAAHPILGSEMGGDRSDEITGVGTGRRRHPCQRDPAGPRHGRSPAPGNGGASAVARRLAGRGRG